MDTCELDEEVNNYINDGWQPWGFLSMVRSSEDGILYTQTMVKYSMDSEWQKLEENTLGKH